MAAPRPGQSSAASFPASLAPAAAAAAAAAAGGYGGAGVWFSQAEAAAVAAVTQGYGFSGFEVSAGFGDGSYGVSLGVGMGGGGGGMFEPMQYHAGGEWPGVVGKREAVEEEVVRKREVWEEEEGSGSEESGSEESGSEGRKRRVKKREGKKGRKGGEEEDGRKKRREMESPVPWTEDMVRFLFETYDDVHRRLWIESRGKVKNQKKWDPIIKTMQERFGRDFTKNQCESKYWKVRRECARFKSRSEKRALAEPVGKIGKSGRDLMKPKFYDVWLEVAGNDPVKMPEIELSSASGDEDGMSPGRGCEEEDMDGSRTGTAKHAGSGSGSVKEMRLFLSSHQEASEKREEALNIRAELTMELLREHMDRMERRGSSIDETRKAQLSMLEGVENKLDRLLHGLTALNGNIGAIVGRLASLPQH